jgi:alpha-mannosidase
MRSALLLLLVAVSAAGADGPDLTQQPTLYVVGYAHLDTQWRWEYPRTITEFLPKTLRDNFALFEKYPHYIFNFSGANRYRMMKQFYPSDYERMRAYVKAGRWFPAGSSMEESDVNSPSAESIIRQVLYGSHYFRRDFGKSSAEYMLPDCFGFPASLPSILAHMGIKGFSTQKLTWGSAVGIPFNVGIWEGPDGRSVIAAFNPGDYSGDIWYDLSKSETPADTRRYIDWPARVRKNGQASGVFTDYHYYGTGDTGGAPRESSVKLLETIVTKNDGPLRVVSSTAEQMFLDIKPSQTARLPRYKGELELTEHSAGSLTSQAYQKRWNRKNELLADASESASVAAAWLGGRKYPQERLNNAWTLVMGGQFHDIAAGTATPKAYEYSWNDDVLAMNQFAAVLTDATESIASALNTQTKGTPVIVYNPLNVEREDIVEVPSDHPVRVFAPDGKEVPSQLSNGKAIFLARVPSVGFAVYDMQVGAPALAGPGRLKPALHITESSLENERYRLGIDANGDVASILDKKLQKELLSAPARLAFQTEKPHDWPAWNMDWADQQKPPRAYVQGRANVRIVENGPARVALEITREGEGSKFVQTIRLAAGDAGNRIEFANAIDWKTPETALKATFPLTASNPMATYNWEVGTIQRGNNDPKKYEVASHQWFDLTDRSGSHGVTILSDCKYGSDKPDDSTVRLTLIYTPGIGEGIGRAYSDQASQDWGHHEFVYGLASHEGKIPTDWQALRLNQPLIAFIAPKHAGALGRSFSLLNVSNGRVRVMALKKAEESDAIILRIVELDGKPANDVRLKFAAPIRTAREVNGQEMPLGTAPVTNGTLVTSLKPYQLRTFALRLAAPPVRLRTPRSFELHGRGTVSLPPGARRIRLFAFADGDQTATFRIGDQPVEIVIQDQNGYIGQWDNRTWTRKEEILPPRPDAPPDAPARKRTTMEVTGLTPGFIKRAPVAWYSMNESYQYSYVFAYSFEVPARAKTLTLPDDPKIHIVSVTASEEGLPIRPAQPLYDTLQR